ncbi:MAG: potassium transporter Trk [Candidatus Cloacimonetes bacterium]|nr:potassium transporter Trk [Candidatus Cloacimonadota bacterium]
MIIKLLRGTLAKVEQLAYLLAVWSFLVLFLQPVIAAYLQIDKVEIITALINICLLFLTIINRLLARSGTTDRSLLFFDLIMLALGALLIFYSAKFVIFFLLARQTWHFLQYFLFHAFDGRFYRALSANPPVSLMLSFALVIAVGTVLLMMPSASSDGKITSFVDALFTATSATCVTGLMVNNVGTYYSFVGQLIILLLIQIGGLGIMTISTAFAIVLGQRLTMKMESVMYQMVGGNQRLNVLQLLKRIVIVTFLIEVAGAALLYIRFSAHNPPQQALYYSIFHSISAFCHAGISVFPDSLMSYSADAWMNLIVSLLSIVGSLGFIVIIDLSRYLFTGKKRRKLALHSKIVLITTAALLGFGMLSFFITEYWGAMSGFPFAQRVLASWAHSVNSRTVGFHTIDISLLGRASIMISLLLMFIGASPGSTGGGVKTTTFAVLVLSITSLLKGKKDLVIFNRKISAANIRQATSLVVLSAAIIFVITVIMLMIEPFSFHKMIFETVSAFGTVGLSMGITPLLGTAGRLFITLLMYVGRIGPLTMIYAFAIKRQAVNLGYAEEKIAIG